MVWVHTLRIHNQGSHHASIPLRAWGLVAALSVQPLLSQSGSHHGSSTTAVVAALNKAFDKALVKGDAAEVAMLYTEDAVLFMEKRAPPTMAGKPFRKPSPA